MRNHTRSYTALDFVGRRLGSFRGKNSTKHDKNAHLDNIHSSIETNPIVSCSPCGNIEQHERRLSERRISGWQSLTRTTLDAADTHAAATRKRAREAAWDKASSLLWDDDAVTAPVTWTQDEVAVTGDFGSFSVDLRGVNGAHSTVAQLKELISEKHREQRRAAWGASRRIIVDKIKKWFTTSEQPASPRGMPSFVGDSAEGAGRQAAPRVVGSEVLSSSNHATGRSRADQGQEITTGDDKSTASTGVVEEEQQDGDTTSIVHVGETVTLDEGAAQQEDHHEESFYLQFKVNGEWRYVSGKDSRPLAYYGGRIDCVKVHVILKGGAPPFNPPSRVPDAKETECLFTFDSSMRNSKFDYHYTDNDLITRGGETVRRPDVGTLKIALDVSKKYGDDVGRDFFGRREGRRQEQESSRQ